MTQQKLQQRSALVCGASQGIGRACALELARLGAEVTIIARDEAALKNVVGELPTPGAQPVRHGYLVADFADASGVSAKVAAHLAAKGPCHILVNNTGGPHSGAIYDSTPGEFLDTFSKHVICNQLLVQAVLPGMKQAGFGRIINIISTSVIQPIRGLGVSNTIRGAVAQWGRTMAAELGPFGITVNNVLPGYTDTARLRSLLESRAKKAGTSLQEVERGIMQSIPLGRFARAEEIAAAVGFLATPAASYVSGVNLPVDGGRTAVQ